MRLPTPPSSARPSLATAIRRRLALTALAVFVGFGFGPIPVFAAETPAFVSGTSSLVGESPSIPDADIGAASVSGSTALATWEECPWCVPVAIILVLGEIIVALINSGDGQADDNSFEVWLDACVAAGGIPKNVEVTDTGWTADCVEKLS